MRGSEQSRAHTYSRCIGTVELIREWTIAADVNPARGDLCIATTMHRNSFFLFFGPADSKTSQHAIAGAYPNQRGRKTKRIGCEGWWGYRQVTSYGGFVDTLAWGSPGCYGIRPFHHSWSD